MKKKLLAIVSLLASLSMLTACNVGGLFDSVSESSNPSSQPAPESTGSEDETSENSDETSSSDRVCIHTGGEATCTEKAVCNLCGEPYGEEPEGHKYTEFKYDADSHWYECACGEVNQTMVQEHTGGTATCTEKAVCSVCEQAYGEEPEGHKYTELKYDADSNWYE